MKSNENKQEKPLFLITGFVVIISIIILLSGFSISRNQSLSNELELVVDGYNHRIKLVRKMRIAARERITIIYSALNSLDEFDRDEFIQKFWDYGASFMSYRAELLDAKLLKAGQEYIDRHTAKAKIHAPPQREVIAMIETGKIAKARRFLVDTVEPNQAEVLLILDEYLNYLHDLTDQSFKNVTEKNNQTVLVLVVFSIIAILVGVFISLLVTKKMSALLKEKTEAAFEADVASKNKTHFLANITHEIKTPINAILGFSYIVLQSDLGRKQKQYVEKIHKSSNELLALVEGILDFSNISEGKLELNIKDFSLHDMMQKLLKQFEAKAKIQNNELVLNILDTPNAYRGDNSLINKVLFHLIDNAIKFTENGKIDIIVELTQKQSQLSFSIIDNGMGIDDETKKSMFHSFTQGDGSASRKHAGTGVGLSLVKNITEFLGGDIEVVSGLNSGSIFKVNIPIVQGNEALFKTNKIIEKPVVKNPKKAIEKPKSLKKAKAIDKEKYEILIKSLKELLEDSDSDAVETVEELENCIAGHSGKQYLTAVVKAIENYEFEEAEEALKIFEGKINV